MQELLIRRAVQDDIPGISRLLYQVHKIHSTLRPDLFKDGAKKYSDGELITILSDDLRPVFVAEKNGQILGYAFCMHQQYIGHNNMTDVKTLYIDDLCVDEAARGMHIGSSLYAFVVDFAREEKYYNVTLNVWADNVRALKFYEKLGLKVQKVGMEKIL